MCPIGQKVEPAEERKGRQEEGERRKENAGSHGEIQYSYQGVEGKVYQVERQE